MRERRYVVRRILKPSAELIWFSRLDPQEKRLVRDAIDRRECAQAPYSHYHVGAAVIGRGTVFVGCNVERASYSQTTHAEQGAIDSLVATYGPTPIDAIAVAGAPAGCPWRLDEMEREPSSSPDWDEAVSGAAFPCGQCRQIIWENANGNRDLPVLCAVQRTGWVIRTTIGTLFPYPFGPDDLGLKIFR
jgi:cytidine deaminase